MERTKEQRYTNKKYKIFACIKKMRNKLFVWGIAITITICLIIAVLNSRRETNKSVKSLRDSDSTLGPCQADCKGYRAIDNCAGKQPCSPDESNCFASHTACLSSSTGYRAVDNCAGKQPCSPDESNCFTSPTTCLSSLPPGAKNMCAGITDSTLAKDVSYPCLQQTWAYAGCSKTGKWYPSDNSSGWWHSSPSGSTMVYCYGDQVPGNSPGNCGAGTFGVVNATMKYLASRDTAAHIAQCGN